MSETKSDKKKVAQYKNCLNPPLLTKSFGDDQFQIPIMHVTVGLAVHDIGKLEDELVNFDENHAISFVDPVCEEGVFLDYITYKLISFQ